jgi:hypothetical protein
VVPKSGSTDSNIFWLSITFDTWGKVVSILAPFLLSFLHGMNTNLVGADPTEEDICSGLGHYAYRCCPHMGTMLTFSFSDPGE